MKQLSEKTRGVLLILGAAFCFASMTACVRLSGNLPSFEKAFFRNAFAAVIAFISLRRSGTPIYVPKGSRLSVFCRLCFGTVGLVMNFYAIDRLGLADANMLNKLSPFFATFMSIFVLKERVKPVQILALVAAMGGALLIIRPSGANLQLIPGLAGLLGGFGAGAAYTFLRKATKQGTKGSVIVFLFSMFSCLVCIPLSLPTLVIPSARQLVFLLLCGLGGAGGQFCITAAYTHAPAREISVYDYSQVLFSALIGFVLFGEVPDALSFAGYAIIITVAILNFLYNKKAAETVK